MDSQARLPVLTGFSEESTVKILGGERWRKTSDIDLWHARAHMYICKYPYTHMYTCTCPHTHSKKEILEDSADSQSQAATFKMSRGEHICVQMSISICVEGRS